jgi:hypothetical protein
MIESRTLLTEGYNCISRSKSEPSSWFRTQALFPKLSAMPAVSHARRITAGQTHLARSLRQKEATVGKLHQIVDGERSPKRSWCPDSSLGHEKTLQTECQELEMISPDNSQDGRGHVSQQSHWADDQDDTEATFAEAGNTFPCMTIAGRGDKTRSGR